MEVSWQTLELLLSQEMELLGWLRALLSIDQLGHMHFNIHYISCNE